VQAVVEPTTVMRHDRANPVRKRYEPRSEVQIRKNVDQRRGTLDVLLADYEMSK